MDVPGGDRSRRDAPSSAAGRNKRARPGSGSSPNSIFPFGSPINMSSRSILNPGNLASPGTSVNSSNASASLVPSRGGSNHVLRGRVKAQELYGGPLMFGGRSSLAGSSTPFRGSYSRAASGQFSNDFALPDGGGRGLKFGAKAHRKDRILFSASPYHSAASARPQRQRRELTLPSSELANGGSSNGLSPSSCSSSGSLASASVPHSAEGISSTARLILDTLDKMSTPLRDAQKIPLNESFAVGHDASSFFATPSRAEKRKLIAEKLNITTDLHGDSRTSPGGSPAAERQRRRPNLGVLKCESSGSRLTLKGPPSRSIAFSSPITSKKPLAAQKRSLLTPASSSAISSTTTPLSLSGPFPSSSYPLQQPEQSSLVTDGGGGKLRAQRSSAKRRESFAPTNVSFFSKSIPSVPTNSLAKAPPPSLAVQSMPTISFGKASTATSAISTKTFSSELQLKTPSEKLKLPEKQQKVEDREPVATKSLNCERPVFAFGRPVKVSRSGTVEEAKNGFASPYEFSLPAKVEKSSKSSLERRPNEPRRRSVVLPDFLTHESAPVAAPKPVMKTTSLPGFNTSAFRKGPFARPATTMVVGGSVMDVLSKANHKLPDVTSTGGQGIKAATQLRNESVMSILGGEP